MIRAVIGTIAVLAGFVVVERSVDADPGLARPKSSVDVKRQGTSPTDTLAGTTAARSSGR